METETRDFNYPLATIERRKLTRQIRQVRLQADAAQAAEQLASLEQELERVEAQRRAALDSHLRLALCL